MIKYLDHQLIQIVPIEDINDFKCINCGIILYQSSNKNYYFIDDKQRKYYKFLYTCSEWIIKNIIE